MGIPLLLPLLQPSLTEFVIENFIGSRCAIDGYGWLHTAIYAFGQTLMTSEAPCDGYLHAVMSKLQILLKHNIDVTVVFDGNTLPAKRATRLLRREKRYISLQQAKEAEQRGDLEGSAKMYAKCVTVTDRMVANWIYLLKQIGVKYIVAPYEADAQLAYLARTKLVDFIITEDSDLIIYECPLIVFKFDNQGKGDLYNHGILALNTEEYYPMTVYTLRQACILSGCDYYTGIPGLGLKGALKLINSHATVHGAVKTYCNERKDSTKYVLEPFETIIQKVYDAEATFLHQVVVCDDGKQFRRLSTAIRQCNGVNNMSIDMTESHTLIGTEQVPSNDFELRQLQLHVNGSSQPDTGFVACESDFERQSPFSICTLCGLGCDCKCSRHSHHEWYRDALLAQHVYETPFQYDGSKKSQFVISGMSISRFNNISSKIKTNSLRCKNYKKRKVSYMSVNDIDEDADFPSPPESKRFGTSS